MLCSLQFDVSMRETVLLQQERGLATPFTPILNFVAGVTGQGSCR